MASINKRVYYAVHAVGFAAFDGAAYDLSGYTVASGVQSVSINTNFNLEQVFQLGQLELYENIENLPSVECTIEKVLDGAALLQHLATQTANGGTLAGRYNNERCMVAVAYYNDTQTSATGTALSEVVMSGMYISSINFNFPVDGNFTESITLVGNDKVWASGASIGSDIHSFEPQMDGADGPVFGTVLRRQHMTQSGCIWPLDIPGLNQTGNAGENPLVQGAYGSHMQSVNVSVDLGRTELFELGQRGPYHRFADFPTEVTCAIEVLENEFGDLVDADSTSTSNTAERRILINCGSGNMRIDLGTKNRLSSITSTGGDTGGGNRTTTYNYSNFNTLTVLQANDPAGFVTFSDLM